AKVNFIVGSQTASLRSAISSGSRLREYGYQRRPARAGSCNCFDPKTKVTAPDDCPRGKPPPPPSVAVVDEQNVPGFAVQAPLPAIEKQGLRPVGAANVILVLRTQKAGIVHQDHPVGGKRRPVVAEKLQTRRTAHHRGQSKPQPHVAAEL